MQSVLWLFSLFLVLWLPVIFDVVPESVKEATRPWCRLKVRFGDVNVTTGFYSLSHYLKAQSEDRSGKEMEFRPFENEKFEAQMAGRFEYEEAEEVLETEPSMRCRPDSFGYSMAESDKIFPFKGYPRCSSLWNQTYESFSFDPIQRRFSLKCRNKTTGFFMLGPVGPMNFPLEEEQKVFLEVRKVEGEAVTLMETEDYVVARCGNEGPFDIAQTAPLYKKRRHKEAMESVEPGSRPKIIMMLVLDSFSRRHFYQKLPLTVNFLKELNQGKKYAVFDFKFHNVMGDGSVQNTIPIFSSQNGNTDYIFADMLGANALWHDFKSRGFISAVYFEGCDQMFPDEMGRNVQIDHLSRQFMCSVAGLGGYTSLKQSSAQRCVGPHMAHVYGFQYISTFSRQYANASQFIYHHYEAAHEGTGLHAETIDQDLRDFLSNYLAEFGKTNDIILYLQADHGMR